MSLALNELIDFMIGQQSIMFSYGRSLIIILYWNETEHHAYNNSKPSQ